MDTVTTHDLASLADAGSATHCVSLYMPTHVVGPNALEDPLRLKNLLDRAEQLLVEDGMRASEARDIVQRARLLPADSLFWSARGRGLALFLTPNAIRRFRLADSLEELVWVGRRFHVKPLLSIVGAELPFFVLAISQNKVRLFQGSRFGLHERALPNLPGGLSVSLNYQTPQRASQVHSAGRMSSRKQSAVFHGQGGESETAKDELGKFLRMVDAAIEPLLRDEPLPLVLAAVERVATMFKSLTEYPHLVDGIVAGNADHATEHELHLRAWPLIEPLLAARRDEALRSFRQWAGTGLASDDLTLVLPAACQGRVATIFVNSTAHCWGHYARDSEQLQLHAEPGVTDEDLLDLAAVSTLQARGTVYALRSEQMPTASPIAAIYRY